MKTLQAQWANYMQQAMPAGAPDLQINEGKVCFMAGAQTMFLLVTRMAADMPDAEAMKFLSGLEEELQQFVANYAATGVP